MSASFCCLMFSLNNSNASCWQGWEGGGKQTMYMRRSLN